jgi:hypothetical protein
MNHCFEKRVWREWDVTCTLRVTVGVNFKHGNLGRRLAPYLSEFPQQLHTTKRNVPTPGPPNLVTLPPPIQGQERTDRGRGRTFGQECKTAHCRSSRSSDAGRHDPAA